MRGFLGWVIPKAVRRDCCSYSVSTMGFLGGWTGLDWVIFFRLSLSHSLLSANISARWFIDCYIFVYTACVRDRDLSESSSDGVTIKLT